MNLKLALALLLIPVVACAAPKLQSNPRELLEKLIATINLKDKKALEAFLTDHATNDVPLVDRVERMMDLGDQGAPFTIKGEPKVEKDAIVATIQDRNGIELDLRLGYTENPLRMTRLMAQPSQAPKPQFDNWKTLDDLTAAVVEKNRAPGMALAMFHAGKLTVAAAGVREVGKPAKIAPDDPLSIGSIGKPLCSTIIGLLIEKGKLRWDQTLKESFPGIPMKAGYEKATLEQIMHHRGGIPGDGNFTRQTVDRLVAGATDPVKIRDNYARDILSRDPIGTPGQVYQYSNAGYALLGHLAEKVTGKSYEQLLKEMIFRPLGLKHSFAAGDKLPEHPMGHMPGPDGLRAMNMGGPLEILVAPAGGGIWMSVGDLNRFGQEHMKGLQGKNGLLKASTVKRLHTGQKEPEGELIYACGWGIESFPGVETFHGHNGSNGTMRAQLCIFPKAGLVVTGIINSGGGEMGMNPGLQAALAIAKRYAKP